MFAQVRSVLIVFSFSPNHTRNKQTTPLGNVDSTIKLMKFRPNIDVSDSPKLKTGSAIEEVLGRHKYVISISEEHYLFYSSSTT